MLTLKQIRKDLQFNHQVAELIDVLKGIASAQFRRLQAKREYFLRFNRCLQSFFETVNLIKSTHPFLTSASGTPFQPKPRMSPEGDTLPISTKSVPQGIVMITSDEGFLGGLNSRVINAGLNQRQEADELIIIGERGSHFLEELGLSFLYFPGILEEIKYEQAEKLRDYLIQQYLKKRFGKVIVVYPKFVSFVLQEMSAEQLLPYSRLAVSGDRLAGNDETAHRTRQSEILVEPYEERIVDYLIRIWMGQRLYDIFWESKLSEWASRVIHLEGSSQVLSELNKKLQFSYFRTLHEISDKNIREIFASRLIK